MTEDQLRGLVREIVTARLSGGREPVHTPHGHTPIDFRTHTSHGILRMAPSVEKGQPCVIEPTVGCALCGFCQSLGH